MSMKLFGTFNRLIALSIAALMIGCGSSESNSGGAPAADGGAPGASVANEAPGAAPGAGREAGTEGAPAEPSADARTVLFVGTSLTAGRGVALERSFPLLIEQRIDEAGLAFRVVNAGISGETSAGARSRVDWLLRQPFDVVVLETGANDMLRGIDPEATERNIQAIIDQIREARPEATIVLAGMLALPNLGAEYAREFEAIYPRLAERNDLPFIPFLLEGVGGERELNQSDGLHPTAEGHRIIADTVWSVLEPVLEDVEAAG